MPKYQPRPSRAPRPEPERRKWKHRSIAYRTAVLTPVGAVAIGLGGVAAGTVIGGQSPPPTIASHQALTHRVLGVHRPRPSVSGSTAQGWSISGATTAVASIGFQVAHAHAALVIPPALRVATRKTSSRRAGASPALRAVPRARVSPSGPSVGVTAAPAPSAPVVSVPPVHVVAIPAPPSASVPVATGGRDRMPAASKPVGSHHGSGGAAIHGHGHGGGRPTIPTPSLPATPVATPAPAPTPTATPVAVAQAPAPQAPASAAPAHAPAVPTPTPVPVAVALAAPAPQVQPAPVPVAPATPQPVTAKAPSSGFGSSCPKAGCDVKRGDIGESGLLGAFLALTSIVFVDRSRRDPRWRRDCA